LARSPEAPTTTTLSEALMYGSRLSKSLVVTSACSDTVSGFTEGISLDSVVAEAVVGLSSSDFYIKLEVMYRSKNGLTKSTPRQIFRINN
jgi:hypothetical protein